MNRWHVVLFSLVFAGSIRAQEASAGSPPKMLLVVTEETTSGSRGNLDESLARLKRDAQRAPRWLSGHVILGDANRSLTIFPLERYGDASALLLALMPQTGRRVATSVFRAELYELDADASFDGRSVSWRDATAFALSEVLLRRGATGAYRDQQVLAARLLRGAGVSDETWVGYERRFGGQAPAYLFVTPLRSLGDLDIDMSGRPALFTPEQLRGRAEALRTSVISDSQLILAIDRDRSHWP
jgi:hypothetical protein